MAEAAAVGWNLVRSAVYAAAAVATYVGFVLTPSGQLIDASALGASILDLPDEVRLIGFGMLRTGLIAVLVVAAIALGVVALVRRRLSLVGATLACSLVAFGGVSLIKRVLSRPDLGVESYDHNTWPSGHVAAVCALALACLRLLPEHWHGRRFPVWAAVAVVTLAAYSSVATYAHRPSDTLAAVLLSGAVFAPAYPGGSSLSRFGQGLIWVVAAASASAGLVVYAHAVDAGNLRMILAVGSLSAMFGTACWVLLPEVAHARSSRRSLAAAP